MSTTGIPLIRYIPDYDEKAEITRKKFQLTNAGGGRSELHVAYATGESTEFLIEETYKPLEDVRETYMGTAAPWDGPRRFIELKHCLRGNKDLYFIVGRDLPNADKTM